MKKRLSTSLMIILSLLELIGTGIASYYAGQSHFRGVTGLLSAIAAAVLAYVYSRGMTEILRRVTNKGSMTEK